MKLIQDLIIIDLEMDQPSGKIIEIGAVFLSRDFRLCESFQSLVCIGEPINPEITALTGITDEMLDPMPPLKVVFEDFCRWTSSYRNFAFASWGGGDVKVLHHQAHRWPFRSLEYDVRSMAAMGCALMGTRPKNNSLQKFLDARKIEFIGRKHRAYDDAWHAARLLQDLHWESEKAKGLIKYADDILGGEK